MPKARGTLAFIMETMSDAKASEFERIYESLGQEVAEKYQQAAKELTEKEAGLALYAVTVLLDVQAARSTNEAKSGIGRKKKQRSS